MVVENSRMNNSCKNSRLSTIKAMRIANTIAFTANRKVYLSIIILTVLHSASVYISLSFIEYVVNAAYYLVNRRISFNQAVITVLIYTAVMLIFLGIKMIITNLRSRLTLDVDHMLKQQLNKKLSHIEWEYYESHEAMSQIFEVRRHSVQAILELIETSIAYYSIVPAIVTFLYYLLQINLLVIPVYIFLVIVFNIKLAGKMFSQLQLYWKEVQPYSQKQNYYLNMTGDKVSHQEYRFLRLFEFASSRWEKYFDSEFKIKLKIFRKHEITLQTARLIFNIPYILMMIFIGIEVMQGKHEVGFLIMANRLLNQIIDTCINIQNNIAKSHINRGFTETWQKVMAFNEIKENQYINNFDCVEFNNIAYSYPQSGKRALNGLNLSIKRGSKIAVVGVNGSGKTTFTNLLLNLTKRFEGTVTTDGKPMNLNMRVSCVIQDFAQYQLSVQDNIAMGDINHDFSDEEIWNLLEKVGLRNFIASLPNGIHTPLGQLDDGIEFSKGQWQRIAIARLLAKQDADIWILDEPTAYLDPISEIEIYDLIYSLSGHRTVLFISHRLGFAKRADEILVFHNGQISERGTHEDLMKLKGRYAKMYEVQQSWYEK